MAVDDKDIIDPSHPRLTHTLVGHRSSEQKLLEAWQSGRFPHGWLFTGPPGIGKATLAFRLTRFVLADGTPDMPEPDMFGAGPDTLDIDPVSQTARRIASGGHGDFRYLALTTESKTIPVDAVRDVAQFAYLTSSNGGWKTVLIDGAEDMNPSAANALLKLLEEPPDKTLIILVTHAPGRLLPTIRSRCRMLKMQPLDAEDVVKILRDRLPSLSDEEGATLARLADGQAGRAIHYAEQGALDLYRAFIELMRRPDSLDRGKLYKLGDELAKKGAEVPFEIFRTIINGWLKRAIAASARGLPPSDILPGDGAIAQSLIATRGADTWLDASQEIITMLSRTDAPANLGRKHVIVNAFILLERTASAR